MGVWEEFHNNKSILINEEAIDILMIALDQITHIYEEDLIRKPTVHELEILIFRALEHMPDKYLLEMENNEVAETKIKVKKAKKKYTNFKPGDIIAIPLNERKIYAYGMITKGHYKADDLYIEYYDLFTPDIITLAEYKNKEKNLLFTIDGGNYGIISGNWKIIGSSSFDESSYQIPDFYGTEGGSGSYFIIKSGMADDPNAYLKVTQEEAEKVKNPFGSWGDIAIQELLSREYLKRRKN